jgi:CRP/FNR family transcriptional regulator, nitrogen fixation regulation protein
MFATHSDLLMRPTPNVIANPPARCWPGESSATSLLGSLLGSLGCAAALIEVKRDANIMAQGETAEYCYEIVSGCARMVSVLEDGRRQVSEFFFAGDVFGLETSVEHECAVEAVTEVRLHRSMADQVRAARARLVLLGRMTASERIANFLLEMNQRLLRASSDPVIELPMCRTDMADYLGLTIETVSRGLSELRKRGVIAVERTRIAIQNPRALAVHGSHRLH